MTNDTHHMHACHTPKKFDVILHGSLVVIVGAFLANMFWGQTLPTLHEFAQASLDLLSKMWWGVALGILVIGVMNKIPREYFTALMGRGDNLSGLLRAVAGGMVLDLCCHGILLVAAKLYERGVSLGQVMAFLIASPWNSLSLTLVLIGLIGLKWTLLYILGSIIIALTTGWAFMLLVRRGALPGNPHAQELAQDYRLGAETKKLIKGITFSRASLKDVLGTGWREGQTIIKWLLFGTVLAASLHAFIPPDMFGTWFGPNIIGLLLTVIAATLMEICSEGSAPIAAELVSQAGAPGNGFAFLMAGVSTDYTEMLAIRQFTGSWKIAFALPLLSVPQVLLLGWIMNMAGI